MDSRLLTTPEKIEEWRRLMTDGWEQIEMLAAYAAGYTSGAADAVHEKASRDELRKHLSNYAKNKEHFEGMSFKKVMTLIENEVDDRYPLTKPIGPRTYLQNQG